MLAGPGLTGVPGRAGPGERLVYRGYLIQLRLSGISQVIDVWMIADPETRILIGPITGIRLTQMRAGVSWAVSLDHLVRPDQNRLRNCQA